MLFSNAAMAFIAMIGVANAQAGVPNTLDPGASFCPSCVGNKYTDPVTGQDGCCQLGYHYVPATCAPDAPDSPAPNCPSDDRAIVTYSNVNFRVYCTKTTAISPDLGVPTVADAKACAKACAEYKGSKVCQATTFTTDGKCYLVSKTVNESGSWGQTRNDATTFIRQ